MLQLTGTDGGLTVGEHVDVLSNESSFVQNTSCKQSYKIVVAFP